MEALVEPLLSSAIGGGGGGYGGGGDKRRMPLSTPDLQFLLETMQLKSEEIKDRVYTTVESHYQDFVDLVSQAGHAAVDAEALGRDFEAVLGEAALPEQAFDSRICRLATEVQQLEKELRVKQLALDIVDAVVALRDQVLASKETFSKGNIVQGARRLAELSENIAKTTGSQQLALLHLLEALREQVQSEVEWVLEKLFRELVLLDIQEGSLVVKAATFVRDQKLKLPAVLEAMNVLGVLDVSFSRFVDALQKPLTAFVNDPCRIVTLRQDSENAVLGWSSTAASEGSLSPQDVYDRVLKLVKFLHEHIASGHAEWMRRMGRLIWPKLADLIIEGCLRKAVPVDPLHFPEFQRVQELTEEFEKALEAESFIDLKGKHGALSHFATEMEAHFALKKKNRVLAKARHLITQFDYHLFLKTVGRVEEKSEILFRKEEYAVSYLPKQLLSIVHEILKDACSCTPRIVSELHQVSRDVILLFRAVVPVQFGTSMIQGAAICHNDCLYIAHELLGIRYEYKTTLPQSQELTCTFADLVPLFQSMAEEILTAQLQTVKHSLMKAVDIASGFRSTDERRNREATTRAIEQVVALVKSAQEAWLDVLSKSVEEKLLLDLVETVMKRVVSEVVSLNDIGADETVELHNVLEDLSSRLLSALQEASGNISPETVPSWKKLRWLSAILEMSMRPITKAWECGELRNAGFSSSEVRRLIRAIFTDTTLRSECLERIVD